MRRGRFPASAHATRAVNGTLACGEADHAYYMAANPTAGQLACAQERCAVGRRLGFEWAFAPEEGCSISTIASDSPLSRRGALPARLEVAKGCASSCGFRFERQPFARP